MVRVLFFALLTERDFRNPEEEKGMTNEQQINEFCIKHVRGMHVLNWILDRIAADPQPMAVDCFLFYLASVINKRWPGRMNLNPVTILTRGEPPSTIQ